MKTCNDQRSLDFPLTKLHTQIQETSTSSSIDPRSSFVHPLSVTQKQTTGNKNQISQIQALLKKDITNFIASRLKGPIMKLSNLFFFPLLAGAALLLSQSTVAAQQLSNDPPSYFGGTDHEAYLDWVNKNEIETKYDNSVYVPSIDRSSGAAIHWSVDDEYIHVAVAARCSGWIGFGISEAGGKLGGKTRG